MTADWASSVGCQCWPRSLQWPISWSVATTRETKPGTGIIVIRTGATNIADYLCGRRYLGINRVALCVGLALLIAAIIWRRESSDKIDLPRTDARYWIAMLAAGVFGTAAGDAIAGSLGGPTGMGGVLASFVLALLLAAVLLRWRNGAAQALYYYWVTVCVARTTGTAIADMLAENRTLNIGLPISTLCTGIVFVGVLLFWKSLGHVNRRTGPKAFR